MFLDQDLSKMTDEQVEEKVNKLYRIVYSKNQNLARQAYPLLMSLYDEQSRRNTKKFEDHLAKSGVKMDEIINIG